MEMNEKNDGNRNGRLGDVDIVLSRGVDNEAVANIPQRKVLHSPDGFEWGYGGSGPADLALNILLCFTDEHSAEWLHQPFKREFLCAMPARGGVIPAWKIRRWIEAWSQCSKEEG